MSDVRLQQRPGAPPNVGDIDRAGDEAKVHDVGAHKSQPLRDPMAYVRHDREDASGQIQRSLKAWRKASGTGGKAAGNGVSQPGEPAEQEADAVADHVAGELHSDNDAVGHDGAKEVGKQAAPAIGAKLEAGTISLAKKNDKKDKKEEEPQKERKGNPGGVQPAPDSLPGFPGALRTKSKTSVQGGGGKRARWILPDGSILEWDSRHGAVEKYNKRGAHQGEFDPNTGAQLKPADKTRTVDS
jgi:hypothetical protein